MGLFRRRHETYNEQLMREAGLAGIRSLAEPQPSLLEKLGVPLGRGSGRDEWDAYTTVSAPGLAGDRITFATRPDGDVIVEEEQGDADVSPLADAAETRVQPPYRVNAVRQGGDLWALAAKRIEVERIDFDGGDRLELARKDGRLELRVEGTLREEVVPELERLGERIGAEFYVDAVRLDGDLWEIEAVAL